MPNFRYRALTQKRRVVSGSISAPTAAEVARRIEYLGLVPIDTVAGQGATIARMTVAFFSRPRGEDVTVFTRDLALLLRPARGSMTRSICSPATSMSAACARSWRKSRRPWSQARVLPKRLRGIRHCSPPMYVALVRVGEASGTLDQILEVLADERARAEALRRKLLDALQYPAFVLAAACGVLLFFLLFVLPQFAAVLRDFDAKLDPVVGAFLDLSDALHAHTTEMGAGFALALIVLWLGLATGVGSRITCGPAVAAAGRPHDFQFLSYRAVLPQSRRPAWQRRQSDRHAAHSGDIMSATGGVAVWTETADRVRHGGKLSDALAATAILPPMAVRMLRLGEETGQLPMLAGRVAEFYEAKLQRSLDRIVGIAGPAAIIVISIVVGGLIVSVMTALLSVSQIVG